MEEGGAVGWFTPLAPAQPGLGWWGSLQLSHLEPETQVEPWISQNQP